MKMDFSHLGKAMVEFVEKNGSKILLGVGISGMILSTVVAVKKTPEALSQIEGFKRKREREVGVPVELTKKEIIKACWKCYIPAGSLTLVSISCLVGSSFLSDKKQAALAAAYTLSESAFRDYRTKVISEIGSDKEKKIKDSIVTEKVSKIDNAGITDVIYTGQGDVLCYDYWSDRLFYSDKESIRRAENNVNRDLLNDGYISLNDFYYDLNLASTKAGDILGWDTRTENIVVEYTSILTSKGKPCLAISFSTYPYQGYDKFAE